METVPNEVNEVLEKLKHLVEGPNKIEVLTRDEIAAMRRVIKTVEMLESWGKLGKGAFWMLSLIAGGMIAWEAIVTRIGK